MDYLDDKLRKIVMAGIGAIAETVEKSRDAIAGFAGSEQAKALADKGEKTVQSVVDAGAQAFKKVKTALSEAELEERIRREKERLKALAGQVRDLTGDQLEVFEEMLKELRKEPERSFGPKEGKDPASEEALGKAEVHESDFDPPLDNPKNPLDGKVKKGPLDPVTPTSPDDEHNIKRMQANAMNEHLKQNVPPDF